MHVEKCKIFEILTDISFLKSLSSLSFLKTDDTSLGESDTSCWNC